MLTVKALADQLVTQDPTLLDIAEKLRAENKLEGIFGNVKGAIDEDLLSRQSWRSPSGSQQHSTNEKKQRTNAFIKELKTLSSVRNRLKKQEGIHPSHGR